ncbi:MAG TPA: tetratricopeptide repeat protein [Bryobacteraceae bacterium]|jgi:tetratricopeptide (TPR) repeat protein|nr:tetratricopeptide repeat protein [Bryobacteraceae bacterium]
MKRGTTVAILTLIVVCLAAADQFLARVESAEVRNTAEHSYATGSRLLENGKAREAIDDLRDAHSLERQNDLYAIQLIAALTSAGRINEAEPLLTEVLQREPNDGRASLAAAHLMERKGDMAEAEAYFHRAIYGQWQDNTDARRIAVRMELIDLLAQTNRKQELLAELISLQAESPADAGIQRRLGPLFLEAGSPARAIDVYHAILDKDHQDIAALEGLGEAELEEGQYRAAREAFDRAHELDAENESVRNHLNTLSTVTGLDPTPRQLTSAEKYRRSRRILEMAREQYGACVTDVAQNRTTVAAADAALARSAPAHVTNEAAEEVLSIAEMLWHAAPAACAEKSEPLRLIMRKLAA